MKNFKKLMFLVAVVMTALVCFTVSASALSSSGKCGDNVTYTYNTTTDELVISGTGPMTDYENFNGSPFYNSYIESVVISEGVTTIGDSAFRDCYRLTEVIIGDGVTTIGDYAFYWCESLTEVTIPDSVTTIGDYTFSSCDSLTEVTIGDGVTTIGDHAFCDCYSLTEVIIPDSVETIGDFAFSGDPLSESNLTSVIIGDGVTKIGDYAFSFCFNLKSVELGDSVKIIGERAFYSCESLTEVTIPDSVETIGDYAFSGDPLSESNLTSVIIGDGVTKIGDYAFSLCFDLKSVELGDSVKIIGDYAFESCGSLTEVIIGDSVTTIGYGAFYNCDSLTEVTIGDSVTTIGYEAFYSCDSLTDVYYGGTQEQWKKIKIGPYNSDLTEANIHYTCYHINKTSHLQQNPTCTSIGYSAGVYCPDCEKWVEGHEVIPATNHPNKKLKSQQDATCITVGYTAGTYCPDCKKWVEGHVVIEKLPHSFTQYIYDENETCTVDGTKTSKCDNCDTKSTIIAENTKTNHKNKVDYSKQNPTCTEIGYTAGVYCHDCEKWLEGHEEIPATNHPNKKLKSQQDATCITVGYTAGTYCPDCRKWIEGHKEIPSKGHTFSEKIIDSAHLKSKATVEKAAIYKYDCSDCDTISSSKTFSYGKPLTLGAISKLTAVPGKTSVALSWNKAENATGYRVYYKLAGDLNWRVCISYTTKTTYIFDDLPSGEYYKFAVKSLYKKSDGKYISGGYKELQTSTQPLAPTTITATQTTSTITLNWSACKGATGYRVYQYSPSKGKYVQIASVKGKTTYTKSKNLKAGSQYKFKIKPYVKLSDGTVIWGEASDAFTTATKPVPPTKITATTTSSAISLKWTASAGATGYRVYQYSPSKGKYVQIASVKGVTSYKKSKSLKANTTYKFKVKPYVKLADGTVIWGKASGEFAFKTKA